MIAAAALATAVYRQGAPAPPLKVSPTQKDARFLTQNEVERLLGSQLQVVRRVDQVPPALRQSFSNLANVSFEMVNPGRPMSTDYIIPGVPSRRLVFAGIGKDVAVLVYEQGGYADTLNAAVFSYITGGGAWIATLNGRSVNDLPTLNTAVKNGQFRTWKRRE